MTFAFLAIILSFALTGFVLVVALLGKRGGMAALAGLLGLLAVGFFGILLVRYWSVEFPAHAVRQHALPIPHPVARLETDLRPISVRDDRHEIPVERQEKPPAAIEGEKPLEVVNHDYRDGAHGSVHETTVESLPAWVSEDRNLKPHSDTTRSFVISSQRFATSDEARTQLLSQLKHEVQKYYPLKDFDRGILDHLGDLLGNTIHQEAVVTWPLSVGGFDEKVYQVHWQVELTDQLRQQLLRSSRDGLVYQRLKMLGLGTGVLTILLAGGALAGRRKSPAPRQA